VLRESTMEAISRTTCDKPFFYELESFLLRATVT
jgi:hypothetical protein